MALREYPRAVVFNAAEAILLAEEKRIVAEHEALIKKEMQPYRRWFRWHTRTREQAIYFLKSEEGWYNRWSDVECRHGAQRERVARLYRLSTGASLGADTMTLTEREVADLGIGKEFEFTY